MKSTRRILCLFAHPDDETFGPGSTLAKYAAQGHEIYVLCATKGESGQWSKMPSDGRSLAEVREKEHAAAAKILGIKHLEYLGYLDGEISNNNFSEIIPQVVKRTREINPDIILTFDLLGLSGHLDHIAMALIATQAFHEVKTVRKLYYFVQPKSVTDKIWQLTKRRVWGRRNDEITTVIDVKKYLPVKMKASQAHLTQKADYDRLKWFWKVFGNKDNFVLGESRVKTRFIEDDLLAGLS